MLSGLVRLFCPSDPLPTLPNEGVPEALAVRCDQTGGGTGKMDRQDKRAGVNHLPQKTPTRHIAPPRDLGRLPNATYALNALDLDQGGGSGLDIHLIKHET